MRGKVRVWAALGALLVSVAACGGPEVVVEGTPVASPYDGTLSGTGIPDDPDVRQRSGPAVGALECDGPPDNGGAPEPSLTTSKSSPAEAVADWMSEDGSSYAGLPRSGYRKEVSRDGRVLLSFDVDGQTKAAIITADGVEDPDGHVGWVVTSWAICNAAELTEQTSHDLGIEVWTDSAGHRVSTQTIQSGSGNEHCDWEDITFLTLGSPPDWQQFVSDDHDGELADRLTGAPDAHAALPADATDTGYRRDGRSLWLAADQSAAYLVSLTDDTDVQRWPRAPEPILCR